MVVSESWWQFRSCGAEDLIGSNSQQLIGSRMVSDVLRDSWEVADGCGSCAEVSGEKNEMMQLKGRHRCLRGMQFR